MSAILSAVLRGEDNLSSIFDNIANSGARMIEKWQTAGTTASTAFTQTTSGADVASKAIEEATSSTDSLASSISDFDKSAVSAADSAGDLADASVEAQDALSGAAGGAEDAASAFSSAVQEAEDFKAATAALESELQELQNAYIGTALQKGKNSEEARALQTQIESLSETINENRRELDDLTESAGGAETGVSNMTNKIEQVLVSAGIAKLIGMITQAVMQMANEFSNAEATIIRASSASGRELNEFRESMFNVFATARSGDLSSVATVITEVNTRLNLQGEELERTTRLFMDFSDMTGVNVTGSIQTLSQVMTRWNMDAHETEGLLDRLLFASQASGAGIDSLKYNLQGGNAALQALGFGLDESIALFASLESRGFDASAAMYGLRRVVIYASRDGRDAAEAFTEIIDKIYNMEDAADATALAVEVFGVRAGVDMAAAIQAGAFEIDEWIGKIESADGTLAATANAAATLEERWTQASNQMNVAFSGVLSPAISTVSGAFADMKMGVGEFLADNPVIVAVLSGLATGFMAVAGGIAIYKLAMTIGTVVTAIFGTTLSVALWPITLIVGAIAALTTGLILLFNWLGNTNEEFNSLSATSKLHYEEVQNLRREYERANLVYDENSAEVARLRGEMEAAQLVFEANRMTIEEFTAANDRLIDSHRRMADSFHDNITAIDTNERSATSLISRLADLSSQTNLTAAEQMQMSTIVDELNSRFPEMSLAIDDVTGSLNMSVEAMRELAQAQAEQERMVASHQAFVEALGQEADLRAQLAVATDELAAAQQRADDATWHIFGTNRRNANNDLAEFQEEYNRLTAALQENLDIQTQTEAAWERQAEAMQEAAAAAVSYEDAVNRAIRTVASDLEDLTAQYDEAFSVASRSITGQFRLWEEAAEVVPKSIEAVTSAMETQIAHWQAYNDNLAGLSERTSEIEGLADLINSFADGSPNSIAMIAGMSEATDEELANMVASWKDLQVEQDAVSHSLAELATDFSNGMSEIESRMHEAIDNMNMETDAAAAARETISAYINQIRSMTGEAQSAAEAVAQAAINALGGSNISLVGIPGFATGTTNAPNMFIAGEEGPELIVGAGGSTVFTADETRNILNQTHTPVNTSEPVAADRTASTGAPQSETAAHTSQNAKRITLSLDGQGEIRVTGSRVDEETVWDYVAPRLKEAFFGILQEEIFEEGDLAHAF